MQGLWFCRQRTDVVEINKIFMDFYTILQVICRLSGYRNNGKCFVTEFQTIMKQLFFFKRDRCVTPKTQKTEVENRKFQFC